MLGQAFCQHAGRLLVWCQSLTTFSLWCQKSISCLFDLGIDWPVRPLMQEDKAVTHQFSLALPHNFHKPLSTCGMVPQHLSGAGLGFRLLLITVHTIIRSQTQQFLNISCAPCWKHTMDRFKFLPCPAGICEAHTTNQH